MDPMAKKETSSTVAVAPLRTLDDFVLESARFQVPNLKATSRWHYRVEQNLMYYQTNYFMVYIILFLLYCNFHPLEVVVGAASSFVGFFVWRMQWNDQPVLRFLSTCVAVYAIGNTLKSILVLVVGMTWPVVVIYIHASLRMRNVQNKLFNQAESAGLIKSPMGEFLKSFKSNDEKSKFNPKQGVVSSLRNFLGKSDQNISNIN